MRRIERLCLWLGSGMLLFSLSALWMPHDAESSMTMTGFILVLVGAIISGFRNLEDNDD